MKTLKTTMPPHQFETFMSGPANKVKGTAPRWLKAALVCATVMAVFPSVLRVHASMVLEWKLDETNGSPTVADSTGNGNVGIATNATFLPTGGILGGCVHFLGGGDQRIYMDTNGVFPIQLSNAPDQYPITASVWFKSDNTSGTGQLLSFGTGIFNVYHACRQSGQLDERNVVDYLVPYPGSPAGTGVNNAGVWNNVVCVWSNATSQVIYTNGVLCASSIGTIHGVTNQIVQFAIGSLYRQFGVTPANPFAGYIDDAAVWDNVLTDQQIAAIYGLGCFSSGNASDMPQFLAAFNAGTNFTLGGIVWTPTNGLSGAPGTVGGSLLTTNAYVVLDGSGNGMEVIQAHIPPQVSITVNPVQIFAGDTVTLSWNVGLGDSATIDQGVGTVPLSGSTSITTFTSVTSTNITWTLVATNIYGATTNHATVAMFATPGPLKLVADWGFDETNGTTAHNFVGTNVTGQFLFQYTNAIAPAWEPTNGYIVGDLFFTTNNATNLVVVRANLNGVVLTNYPCTMAAWVNTEDVVTRNETVLSLCDSNSGSAYYCLQVDAGQARLGARNGSELDLYGGYVYGSGTYADWHYIVCDFERDNLRKIYVDGSLTGTDTNALGGFVHVNRFSAGAIDRKNGSMANPYTGHADEAALFTGTLTPDEVSLFYGVMKGLGLNTAEIDTLRNAFLQNNPAVVHGAAWVPATGLSGSAGTTGGSLFTQDAYIVMDETGDGMQITTSVPAISGIIPSSPVIGSSGLQTLNILGVNFQSGCTVALTNVDTSTSFSPVVTFVNSSNLTINVNLGVVSHNWILQVINPGNASSSLYSFTVAAPPQPRITGIRAVSGNITLTGTNGTAGLTYSVLVSTNLSQPVASWTPLSTNTFGAGGLFNWTNPITAGPPQLFYLIKP